MANCFFDLNKNRKSIRGHKKSELVWINNNKSLQVTYDGELKSAGFRAIVPLKKLEIIDNKEDCGDGSGCNDRKEPYKFVLSVRAKLLEGDAAFIYCETVVDKNNRKTCRLIDRENKNHILSLNKDYSALIEFEVISDIAEISIGILFYGSHRDYKLVVDEFTLTESEKIDTISVRSILHNRVEAEKQFLQMLHKNQTILNDIAS